MNSKDDPLSKFDDSWYSQKLQRLGKDGSPCTKIATNGRPYDRRLLIDTRNMTIQITGGRGGATGVLLDDLVDVRKGLTSPEFDKFCERCKKPPPPDQAVVLQTAARTFSFLLPSESSRDNVAYSIVYLLKKK